MQREEWKPDEFPGMKQNDFYDFSMSIFIGDEKLKLESKQNPDGLTFQFSRRKLEQCNSDKSVGNSKSIKEFFMDGQ